MRRAAPIDQMERGARWPTSPATVATFTVDRLAYSPQPAGGRRRRRLRRRRPVPVRADRRRPGDGRDRRPGRDDVPPAVHARTASTTTSGRRGPLEQRSRADMASHGIRDRVAIVGMGCTPFGEHWDKGADDLLIDAVHRRRSTSAGVALDDVDAFWLGTMGSGLSGPHARRAAEDRLQAGHPRRELLRHRLRGVPQRLLRGRVGRLRRGDGDRRREAEGLRLLRASSVARPPTTAPRPTLTAPAIVLACSPRPTPRSTASTRTR